MPQQKHKTALILGVTGLVGDHLLNILGDDERYSHITCLVRKPMAFKITQKLQNRLQPIVIDFDNLQDYQGYFAVDHVYVCLGTTLKKAGSKEAFRKVDFELVHVAAQLSRAQSAGSFVWISSVGASAKSSSFYLRVKGELENAIFGMSGLENAATVRPSVLLGDRNESRPGERLGVIFGNAIAPLLCGPLKKYRPVHAQTVAKQMINLQTWD
jgi:uncharacterized protein YbjT (DUF2867 family)